MFIITNASPTLPSPTPPPLSLFLSPITLSFLSLQVTLRTMSDWRTDGWCYMQILLSKVQFLSGIFFFFFFCKIYTTASFCLMNSLPLPPEDDLPLNRWINPPSIFRAHINTSDHQCHGDHTCHAIGHTCTVIICSAHVIPPVIEGSACWGANWRPMLDLQVNGGWSQAYRDWWERWRVKACSISTPRGDMGLDTARTHWPLLDSFWTLLWCKLGNLPDKLCPLGVQANGCNDFLYIQIWQYYSHWRKKKSKKRGFGSYYEQYIPVLLRGKSLCFFVFLVGCVSPAWEYHEIINRRWLRHLSPVPLIHQRSRHHQTNRGRIWETL